MWKGQAQINGAGEELKDPFILYLDKALSELEALKNKP
jgi:hypothetical protein